MAVDTLSTWKSNFAIQVTPAAGDIWADNLSNWVDAEVTGKLELAGITGSSFTFDAAGFKTALLASVSPSTDKSAALQAFADAWEIAVNNSSLSVSGGSGYGSTGIIATGMPSNAASAASTLKTVLLTGTNSGDIDDSVFPEAMRSGFLALQFNVTGTAINPAPPPPTIPFSQTDGVQ